TFQAGTVVHEASVRCLSRSKRYRTRIWEAGSCRRSNGQRNKLYIVVVMYHYGFLNIPNGMEPGNTYHFNNRGSTPSKGMNAIASADNQRFEGYIDGCGMCGYVGHLPNDCPILQEPPPPFRPQLVQESSLEDLIKQLAVNNIQFQKNVSATQQPTSGATVSSKQHAISTKYKCHNARFEDSGQVPSQAILSPQENMSDITVRSGMQLPQQQSLKV
ncbi:hypothetical protein CR513_26505, partial [Mucuna pruriens]